MTPTDPARRDAAGEHRVAMAHERQRRGDDDDDHRLADLDAEVEREERDAQRAVGESRFAQHAREPEAVHEAEDERDPRADVAALRAGQQVVGADVDDAQGDGRLDDARAGVRRSARSRAPA